MDYNFLKSLPAEPSVGAGCFSMVLLCSLVVLKCSWNSILQNLSPHSPPEYFGTVRGDN
jgi:hypothetical protein